MIREPAYSYPDTHVAKLQAEIERLRSKQHDILVGRDRIEMELRTEVVRLRETDRLREVAFHAYADQERKDRAEIERLGAALTEYAKGDNWLQEARFDPNSHRFDGISFAMAALEPKP